mmetsp:Transcript_25628/g.81369  ORF Transcript_25628/g.81369 Transcript_25628/m.81369 type:complete len:255 (-) Transcript_25628:2324-3088(-)
MRALLRRELDELGEHVLLLALRAGVEEAVGRELLLAARQALPVELLEHGLALVVLGPVARLQAHPGVRFVNVYGERVADELHCEVLADALELFARVHVVSVLEPLLLYHFEAFPENLGRADGGELRGGREAQVPLLQSRACAQDPDRRVPPLHVPEGDLLLLVHRPAHVLARALPPPAQLLRAGEGGRRAEDAPARALGRVLERVVVRALDDLLRRDGGRGGGGVGVRVRVRACRHLVEALADLALHRRALFLA